MLIPILDAVEPEVNFIGGLDKFIGQARSTAGAEDCSCLPKCFIDRPIPPTLVPEFHDIPPTVIEMVQDSFQACGRVVEAGWKLKQKASHAGAQQVGYQTEVAN